MDLLRVAASVAVVSLCATSIPAASEPVDRALQRTERLSREHRFREVLKLLEPYAGEAGLNQETRYGVACELGRAYFHLGMYDRAYASLVSAVGIHPNRIEIGLYLEAASWVTGRREQALEIFEKILSSGARDLYLAVSLPGERTFLADPRTWSAVSRHAIPLIVDLNKATFSGVRLGDSRRRVQEAFHIEAGSSRSPFLRARAGPKVLWVFQFDEQDRVSEVLIDAENVVRYSPYRIQLGDGSGWRTTAAGAIGRFGQPAKTQIEADGGLILRWELGDHFAELEYGPPVSPRPPMVPAGTAVLRMIRLATGSRTAEKGGKHVD